jgi:DNA processing protein
LAGRVDAIAHQGATAVGRRAITVLGTGTDVCHPKENKKLYEKVLERGAIVSEFPIGSHPAPESFPVRNRITAGMPIGVTLVGNAIQRVADHGAAGHGICQRSIRGTGQRNAGM